MTLRASEPCPPDHTVYLSEMLARNAVTLHRLRDTHCPGFTYFAHGDHWHVGHPSKVDGDRCKAATVVLPKHRPRSRKSFPRTT